MMSIPANLGDAWRYERCRAAYGVAPGASRRQAAVAQSDHADKVEYWRTLLFLALHVPLALAMRHSPALATAHGLAVLVTGLWVAGSARRPEQVAGIAAYIVGAEVLWRMTKCALFWEYGKYATIVVLITVIARLRLRAPFLPLLYFALLIPSTVLTVANHDIGGARQALSFNLSGPLALAISAWFFSCLSLSRKELQSVLLAAAAPITAVLAIAGSATFAENVRFGNGSNFATSGGFGPNQVSLALGLGVLFLFLIVVDRTARPRIRLLAGLLAIPLAAQSALTFSRGGLYSAVAAILGALVFLLRGERRGARTVLVVVIMIGIAACVVAPQLDAFTGGRLAKRFSNTKTTGRDHIAEADIEIWMANPVLGVGPGEGKAARAQLYREIAAHTELSRLLAEHGIFGAYALLILICVATANTRRAPSGYGKAVVSAFALWSFVTMMHAAMRIAAPSVVFGLGFVSLRDAAEENGS